MTKTNTAENLAEKVKTVLETPAPEMTDEQKAEAAKTIVAEATKKTAPQSAMKLFTSSVLSSVAKQVLTAVPLTEAEIKAEKEKGSDATVKMVPIRRKLTDAEMVELGETEAEEFRKIGEGEDSLLQSSADRYAVWGPIFPIRLGLNGRPDIAEFVTRIWNNVPDRHKTPKAGVAGAFMTCTSAARERNQVAKGIVSMSRWVSRNENALFAHLGITKSADEKAAAALKKVETALETVAAYMSEVEADEKAEKSFFTPCDENGNAVIDKETGKPVVLDIRSILSVIKTQLVAPELKSKVEAVDHLKKEREEARKKEEKELLTEEEKKDADYMGEGINVGYKGN